MQTVLITGASSGIGEALANIFAREGYNLVIVARTRATLEQLARALAERYSIQVWVEPVDLSKRTAAKNWLPASGHKILRSIFSSIVRAYSSTENLSRLVPQHTSV